MDFNKIRAGDDIVYFGLPKCSGSGGFEVFVVVINREIDED